MVFTERPAPLFLNAGTRASTKELWVTSASASAESSLFWQNIQHYKRNCFDSTSNPGGVWPLKINLPWLKSASLKLHFTWCSMWICSTCVREEFHVEPWWHQHSRHNQGISAMVKADIKGNFWGFSKQGPYVYVFRCVNANQRFWNW